jgi:hypothetical protein
MDLAGPLFAAGWSLSDVLDLTPDQILLCSSAVARYQARMLGALFGGGKKGKDGKKGKQKASSPDLMEMVLRDVGIPIEEG